MDEELVKETFEKAERGDFVAQNKVGMWCYSGQNVPKDKERAKDFFKKAAVQNHVGAKYNLATIFYEEKNFSEAFPLFLETAEKGNIDAILKVGGMYYRGEGVKKNVPEALKFFRNAAFQGNITAQVNAGVILQEEESLRDLPEAVKWFSKAAEKGSSEARFKLALMYSRGEGAQKDLILAFNFCMQAAEQNHVKAQLNAGLMLSEGIGTGRNQQEACKWFLKAAKGENALAQARLAKAYLEGTGLDKNLAKSLEWSFRVFYNPVRAENETNIAKNMIFVCYYQILSQHKNLDEFVKVLLEVGSILKKSMREDDVIKAEKCVEKEDYLNAFVCYCLAAQSEDQHAIAKLREYYDFNVGKSETKKGISAVFEKCDELLGKSKHAVPQKNVATSGMASIIAKQRGYSKEGGSNEKQQTLKETALKK